MIQLSDAVKKFLKYYEDEIRNKDFDYVLQKAENLDEVTYYRFPSDKIDDRALVRYAFASIGAYDVKFINMLKNTITIRDNIIKAIASEFIHDPLKLAIFMDDESETNLMIVSNYENDRGIIILKPENDGSFNKQSITKFKIRLKNAYIRFCKLNAHKIK